MSSHLFAGSVLLLGALAGGSRTSEGRKPMPLVCRLAAEGKHSAGGPVMVTFVLRNRSARAVSILDWQTPLEGLLGDIFHVVPASGGKALEYRGPMVKRRAPQGDDYVRIPPKGELSGRVDAAVAYDFSRPGRYTLTFRGSILDLVEGADPPRSGRELRPVTLDCGSVPIDILP